MFRVGRVLVHHGVVLLNAPDHLVGIYLPIVRRTLGLSVPRSFHVLSMAPFDQTLEVRDSHTLTLTTNDGAFLGAEIERFWRAKPLRPGSKVRVDGFVVQARSRSESAAIDALDATFGPALDDPAWCVVRDTHGCFERVPLVPSSSLELVKERGPSGL